MKKILALALGLVALAATSAAFAQAGSTDDFGNADGNKDGKVTLNEAMAIYPTLTQALFNQADENHDGTLDQGEFGELKGLSGAIGGSHGGNG